MNRNLQPAVALFAIGVVGVGVLALPYDDFALDWQRYRLGCRLPRRPLVGNSYVDVRRRSALPRHLQSGPPELFPLSVRQVASRLFSRTARTNPIRNACEPKYINPCNYQDLWFVARTVVRQARPPKKEGARRAASSQLRGMLQRHPVRRGHGVASLLVFEQWPPWRQATLVPFV